MNKKLIALAVAAAFAAPTVASAEATIYGNIHTSLANIDQDDSDGNNVQDNWDVLANDGQLGIKGSEDLGGGLKAIYKIEFNFDSQGGDVGAQTASTALSWDEVWVGLTGAWGTAIIGREDSPHKTFMDSPGVDLLGDSIIDVDTMLRDVGAAGFQRFTANGVIAYVSPNFSGFTFSGAFVPGAQNETFIGGIGTGNNSAGNDVEDGIADHYALGANYKMGGLTVAGGYEKLVPLDGSTLTIPSDDDDQTTWGLGASYNFGAFFVGGKYESTDAQGFQDGRDSDRWAVSGKYTFGNNEIGVVYTEDEIDAESTGTDVDASGWGLYGLHKFSNRTAVYVAYGDSEDDESDAEATDWALGVFHSF
jgi:predicted porin